MKRIITMLGMGIKPEPPHYFPVRYRMGDFVSPEPTPIPLTAHLLGADGPFDVHVIGTKEVRARWIDSGLLARLMLEAGVATGYAFHEVPSGSSPTDAATFVGTLLPLLDRRERPGTPAVDEVTFDITHGFRSQSMLATAALDAAIDDALRRGVAPGIRLVYAAYEDREGDVAPIWDLTPLITQRHWTAAVDALLSHGRADALRALCDSEARTLGRDPRRRESAGRLRALGAASGRFADDLVTARIPQLLTHDSADFARAAEAALTDADRISPAAGPALQELARRAAELHADSVVSVDGVLASLKLMRLLIETQRFAECSALLRETCVSAAQLAVVRHPEQPGVKAFADERNRVERSILAEGDPEQLGWLRTFYRNIVPTRNDIQHVGMNAQPRPADSLRNDISAKLVEAETEMPRWLAEHTSHGDTAD